MSHSRSGRIVMSAVGIVVLGAGGLRAQDALQACEVRKLLAAEQRAACLAGEAVKARRGRPSDPSSCEAAFDGEIARADARAARNGAVCRFVDNPDGTISDLNTLLVWEKKEQAGPVHGVDNLFDWVDAMSELVSSVDGFASPRAAGPSPQAGLAGHTDWRLPTVAELRTIVLAEYPNCPISPCVVDPVFNNGSNSFTAMGPYWSSTTDGDNPAFAWLVGFNEGAVTIAPKTYAVYARAVRGGR